MPTSSTGVAAGRRAWVALATLAIALATSHLGRAQLPHWEEPPSSAPPTQSPQPDSSPAPVPADGSPRTPLEANWANGLTFTSPDEQFRIHVGGNAQIDSTWLIGPSSVFLTNGGSSSGIGNAAATFIRRARLRMDGEIYDQFDFVVEYNFANADNENNGLQPPSFGNLSASPAPGNVWMQIRDVPVLGNVRIGYQVKPIGMSNNTSQTNLPFLERPDNRDAFYGPFDNGFAIGVSARNHTDSERITWQYGVYRPLTNSFGVALNKVACTAAGRPRCRGTRIGGRAPDARRPGRLGRRVGPG